HLLHPDLVVVDLRRLRVERRERGDRADQHPHRVRVVTEALHQPLHVLVHEGVVGELVRPALELRRGRELAEDEQVRRLEVGAALGELLDRVAAVAQDAAIAVDERDRAADGRGVEERRVVARESRVVVRDLRLLQRRRADRPVLDRHLEAPSRAVVGDRDRVGHRSLSPPWGRYQLLSLRPDSAARMRTRASTATQPSGPARIGLRSSSATSGRSSASRPSRSRSSARARASAAGAPRKPATSRPALPERTSSSASRSVRGASRNEASPISSASAPPGPNATSGPNIGSWTTPARSSVPPRRNGWTITGSPIRSAADRTCASSRRSRATPPTSVLCTPGAAVFTTAGKPSSRAAS